MKRIFLTGVAMAALSASMAFAGEPKVEKEVSPPPAWLDTLTIDG